MNKTKTIIELLRENELGVGKLYKLYAQKIPAHREFWINLSYAELEHAGDMGKVQDSGKENVFPDNNFYRGAIQYLLDFVKEKIKEAEEKPVSQKEALEIALKIEESFVEKKFFEMASPEDTSLKEALDKLNRETEEHTGLIQKEIEKLKTTH